MSDNSWSRTVEEKGQITTDNGGIDPFPELHKKDGAARVSLTVGRSHSYGELKVSATVTLTCDQNEPMINKTGKYAFMKAVELVEDAWDLLTEK